MMNDRLKAWIGFNDGNCDYDTQMLIDDIKELEEKLAEAVGLIRDFNNGVLQIPELSFENFIKYLEEKEGEG